MQPVRISLSPARIAFAAALFGALTLGGCSVIGGEAAPEPGFETVMADAPFEIRSYPPLILAKTAMDDTSNSAFRRLFRYISGANGGEREIAMTAPVLVRSPDADGDKIAMTAPVLRTGDGEMAFILPKEFTADTAPLPTDPSVELDIIPERKVAVIRFNGRADDALFAEHRAKLNDWMQAKGLVAVGPPEQAQYNPPWTIPAMRRNEVLVPIE
ncbi:MAG: heme-binding protein [Pseudomonadota bacterium]